MAKLEENVFKPEEELQGYIAGEADADTFLLAEDDEYPGMVPDFGSEPEEIEVKPEVAVFEEEKPEVPEEIEESENIEEFVAPVEESAADDINDELDLNIDIDDDDLSDVWSAFGAPDDDEEEELIPEPEVAPEEPIIEPEPVIAPEEPIIEPEPVIVPEEPIIEPEPVIIPEEPIIEPDAGEVDEFKQFLAAQQEKIKAQRTVEEDDDVMPDRNSNAEPVFVEITGDDFQEKKKTPEPEKKKEPRPEKDKKEKPKKEKPEKEEKKRKGVAGWLVAAVLLLMIGLFTAGLLVTDNDIVFLKLVSSMTSKVQNQIMPGDTTQNDEKEESIAQDTSNDEEKIVDFTDSTEEESFEETPDITENITEPEAEEEVMVETKQAPRQKTVNPNQPSKTKRVGTKTSSQTVANNTTASYTQETGKQGIIKRVYEPEDATKQKVASKSTTNNVATPSAKESMIVRTTVPMEAEKTTKTKAIKQDAVEKQTLPSLDRNKGVFSVQVYSTLSKKDATDKVKQLKNMNITNVYISEYRKRDVLWYRVRYGEFESYEQAQQEAKNRGFSNAWIDRIK